MDDEEYIHDYNKFWKDIVENKDGTLNRDQVMRELYDYRMVLDNCKNAYMEMTEGNISKANTKFSEIQSIFDEKFFNKEMFIDDLENMIDNKMAFDDIKKAILEYLE